MSDEISINFDKNIYSAKAIKRALYEINTGKDNLTFEIYDGRNISVTFSSIGNNWKDSIQFIEEFKKSVFDHQIRLDTEESFHVLRQLIVAQAFHPCENIEEIIDLYKP